MRFFSLFSLLGALLFFSCNTAFFPVAAEHESYRVTSSLPPDSVVLRLMQPYRDSVNRSMNEVVGIASVSLDKAQPEGTLGNFMVDALMFGAQKKFGMPLDAAFVNYGGIRLTQLAPGEITRGEIYELMPFDNLVVVQQVKGSILKQFLDHIASWGGWPAAGITMAIKDKKAVNVLINGAPLDTARVYNIVNSDYIANGGDNANMLRDIPQKNIGYLMRDAIFEYIDALKAKGKPVSSSIDKRVIHAQ